MAAMPAALSTFASDMLKGRMAVVTGGSRGIGSETCLALARSGANVVVGFGQSNEAAASVCREAVACGVHAVALAVDVRRAEDVDRFMAEAEAAAGPVDLLVNCAGTWPAALVHELDDGDWQDALAVNLSGTFHACRAASRSMMARRSGRIVNFSSIAADRGARSGHAHYAAAKGGVQSFTRSLANELGPHGINVNAVAPGMIRTDMTDDALGKHEDAYCRQTALGRIGRPEEVAGAVLFLASPAATYITGQTLHVNGGMWMS
jgi:3-oxoacyl-[acyl-carrier protein] reductase